MGVYFIELVAQNPIRHGDENLVSRSPAFLSVAVTVSLLAIMSVKGTSIGEERCRPPIQPKDPERLR